MRTETKKQWWQQLGGMSQGMLFLHGHITHVEAGEETERHAQAPTARNAASARRHERAVQRLSARRLREMTSLSLFR